MQNKFIAGEELEIGDFVYINPKNKKIYKIKTKEDFIKDFAIFCSIYCINYGFILEFLVEYQVKILRDLFTKIGLKA